MNNSFFGKTCEDVRKHKNVVYICGTDHVKKLQKKINCPLFERVKTYGDEAGVVLQRKWKLVLDKPRYVGMCILAISKEVMYDFHYNFILKNFPGNIYIYIYIYISTNLFRYSKRNNSI